MIHYSCEDEIENLSLRITVFYHLTRLVMSIRDPWDRFYCPILTLMMDFKNHPCLLWLFPVYWLRHHELDNNIHYNCMGYFPFC